MSTRCSRKAGLVSPILPVLVVSALLSCASAPSCAAPKVSYIAEPASPLSGLTRPDMTAMDGEAKATQKGPRYVVVGIMDHDLYDYYCRMADTDAGMAALLDKTNFLPGTGFLFNLYRAAASEYMPNLRSFHSNTDSHFGDAMAINNHSEILFRSGTIYKWNGKSVDYVRRTAGPPFPNNPGIVRGARRLFSGPDALGMNDAGVVVGDSWWGLYSCAPGGSSALLAGGVPSAAMPEVGSLDPFDADSAGDPSGGDASPSAEEIAEAVRAMKRQMHGSPAVGRSYPGRGLNRRAVGGATSTNSLENSGREAEEERHEAICDAAYRLLPQGPSKVIFPSASDSFLVQHLDIFNSRSALDAFKSYIGRINNKGHIIGQTVVATDETGGGLLADSPYLFGQGDQFTTLDAVLPLLVKTKDSSLPIAAAVTGKGLGTGVMPGALTPIPWGTSLTSRDNTFLVHDLNDQDHLAGTILSEVAAGGPDPHSGLLRENAAFWNGRMVALQGLANSMSNQAFALNNHDQVVGSCVIPIAKDQSNARAALWQNGKVYDLNSCIAPGSGWSLVSARAINDKGEIVGRGDYQGQRYSFLLVPVSELADSTSDPTRSDPAGVAASKP